MWNPNDDIESLLASSTTVLNSMSLENYGNKPSEIKTNEFELKKGITQTKAPNYPEEDQNLWNPNDDFESILKMTPSNQDNIPITLEEYGKITENGENQIEEELYTVKDIGPEAKQKLASHFRKVLPPNPSIMGNVLVTDEFLQNNNECAETVFMLKNAGIQSASPNDGAQCFKKQPEKKLPHVIHEKKYPVFLDKRFFKFRKEIAQDDEGLQLQSSSSNIQEPAKPTENLQKLEQQFVKPIDLYFMQRAHMKKK